MEGLNAGIWSLVPPLVAIVLALITKEVVFSLILGILSGTVIYSALAHLGVTGVFSTAVTVMTDNFGANASMILFLCFLGILVSLVTKAGGSRAYGEWAARKLKNQQTASLATSILGILIFIDDYFNCLTVGTVMRPVTDKFKMSREKLAYIIDATAAPVCIIAPISSWAASVISYYPKDGDISGMEAFIRSIPMNLYAILTLIMVIYIGVRKNADFGPMAKAQKLAAEGIISSTDDTSAEEQFEKVTKMDRKGRVSDLVVPIAVLIILSILSMLFVGGYFNGKGLSLFEAFGNTSAGPALALASFGAIIFTFIYYLLRRVLNFREFFESITPGVSSMAPACVILTLAWTISAVCRELLQTGDYVAHVVQTSNIPVQILAPVIFLIACVLSFATGTSWGTFGILIPIVLAICEKTAPELMITCLSATLAGSVFGDHCSPISDTTILSSAGARCPHLKHVATQIPYASTVAICCFFGYIVAGFTAKLGFGVSTAITLSVSVVLLVIALIIAPRLWTADKVHEEKNA